MPSLLAQTLKLPCGAVLPNRIAKAAMTEGLADPQGRPTAELERLYGIWSDGGAGMLLSGNIQIDRDHLERPGNVIIDRKPDAKMATALAGWAKAAKVGGAALWMQISHAGRQTQVTVNPHPKAPSAIALDLPGKQFGVPIALTEAEIKDDRHLSQTLLASELARSLCPERKEDMSVAGLMFDLGRLVTAKFLPQEMEQIDQKIESSGLTSEQPTVWSPTWTGRRLA